MVATWSVVGAGAILPRAGFGPAGYALRPRESEAVTLFDCGPGTLRNLPALGIELREVRRVVLSHFHPDHCLDVFALAFARYALKEAARALELVGPRGLKSWLQRGCDALGQWVEFRDTRVIEVEVGETVHGLDLDDLALRHVGTQHTANSLAWRADLPSGEAVTFSGDSRETPELPQLARGCDLFVCECALPDEEAIPTHVTAAGAGRMAQGAAAKRLLLTHFYPSHDPEAARLAASQVYTGPIETARDGLVIRLRS